MKKDIIAYIENTTGWKIQNQTDSFAFPLYLTLTYEHFVCSISGVEMIFLIVKEKQLDLRMHGNAIKKIKEISKYDNVVLVFNETNSQVIHQLIDKHRAFVVLNKYIYLPFALMQIETFDFIDKPKIKTQEISSDADMILIGYLFNHIHNNFNIKKISLCLNRNTREVSAALTILESHNYLHLIKEGRSKKIEFIQSKEEIFDYLKDVKSPIKNTFYTKSEEVYKKATLSGSSALSENSTLLDSNIKTIAISNKVFYSLNTLYKNIECYEEDGKYKVEVWNREPSIFSDNKIVNLIYLLRVFKDNNDERISYAIEDVENKILNLVKVKN